MSLISCPECAREISDRALSCPRCGTPMLSTGPALIQVQAPLGGTVSIEATGKRYKLLQLAGAIAITLAVVSCAVAAPTSRDWSGFVFLTGIALYSVGRVGAWWNHG